LPLQAFVLIILAAFAHAAWNLLAKQASHFKHLIWFSSAGESLLFLPFVIWAAMQSWPHLGWRAAMFLLLTGMIHFLYTESLLRGYREGDLSVVYPVARGTGPLLSFVGAILVLGEHSSLMSMTGALLVTAGILCTSGGAQSLGRDSSWPGIRWGVLTGLTIASYTIVDGYSVRALLVSPLLVEYAGTSFRTIILSGAAWRQRSALRAEYAGCWKEALGISILLPTGYILVLYAMKIASVSHVAPAREVSMMIGAWFGTRFLNEGHPARRMAGSVLIAVGVAVLTLG
jgi:uncharacterized membrane protein